MSMGINMHISMNVNFLNDLLSASPWQQGYLEAIRESCGVMSFFVIVALAGQSEPRVASFMLFITGLGLAAYFGLNGILGVILFSLTWSIGFHSWVPLSHSMMLAYAPKGKEGRTLGLMGTVGATGSLLALGAIWLLKELAEFEMRQLFLMAGLVVLAGSLPLLKLPAIRVMKTKRLAWSRLAQGNLRIFCILELLDGMRKQIFLLFAVLVLVREYSVGFQTIAALMFANQILVLGLAPLAGIMVDRFGERKVLTLYFVGIGIIFLLYSAVNNVHALYVIYVIDNAWFVFQVGLRTFANRIVPKQERTQLLAMGVTMNHVGSVTLPLVGAFLYSNYGWQFPFYCGALIAAVSVVVAQKIPLRPKISLR